jgi:ribonuclease HI
MAKKAKEYHETLQRIDRDPHVQPDPQKINAILSNIKTRTTPPQKCELAKPLSWGKIHQALHESANDKAAGLDGIPAELWKMLSKRYDSCKNAEQNPYCDIVKILTKVFNDIERNGIAPSTRFNEGWMCPLYKKGERNNIANYRPITILNTDYKIMTKALANKLAEVAPTLINRDQAGFIKGRSIFDQVKLAKLTIDYGNIMKQNGAIVALDQEKAYDKILHPYLWKTLEKFDIPQHFINTVKHLYQNAATSVLINGILSDPFIVDRGVRQGDGLSCLIFNLGIEPLAAAIRNSPLLGIPIKGTDEKIKCKLFADDTMVYLDETDDLETLEKHALKPWCEVSGAVFNIAKTEIIPIGCKEYRTNLINTRKTNPNSPPIQPNIKIATDGQPVRVLGAWIGNDVDQATPWTPTIEKIATSLKHWEANHPTTEGRRLITQMIIGGMTQYLAKVQGIPETALKTLETLIRNFAWSGENKPTISMAHMTNATNEGGRKVLDIHTRNEAIQLTWLQAYLKFDNARPTWALVADAILANDVPGEPKSLAQNPNARMNQYIQTWHSRKNSPGNSDIPSIPQDLREMLKIGKKHGVRLEAINPTVVVREEMPAIRHNQTNDGERPDILNDKYGKCIRDKHNVRTLKDITDIAENTPRDHKRNKKCKCARCNTIRRSTDEKCKHPNKCIERATALLRSIKNKWNPTILTPPDFLTNPDPKDVGPTKDEETEETTHTLNPYTYQSSLKDCFRVFTGKQPASPETIVRAPRNEEANLPETVIYTDGSCINNGEASAKAGSGVWYGDNDPKNASLRVPYPDQSNQTGELHAIIHAIQTNPPDQAIHIKTDSMYVIQGLTKNLEKWEDQGWMRTKHAPLFKNLVAWTRYRSNTTKITWIKGHNGNKGNEEADKLAGEGAHIELPTTPHNPPNPPINTIPSGAKLATLKQKDLYYGIKKTNRPSPRTSTENNLGRIQACAEEYYNNSPTNETTWKSTKHKDLSKKTQEFLWKSIHNAFKIGRFWANIPTYEHRGTCPICDTEESMEHILTECTAPGRKEIWSLANELWHKRSDTNIPENYGALLGCCLTTFKKNNGKPDKGLNRLYRIIVSESMYLIWKIRCERTIAWNNDPDKFHTHYEIHNKWLQTINARLKMDSIRTNNKIFKTKTIAQKTVLKTWNNCLMDNLHDTRNWCGKTGVLVGIAPKRPPGRNR